MSTEDRSKRRKLHHDSTRQSRDGRVAVSQVNETANDKPIHATTPTKGHLVGKTQTDAPVTDEADHLAPLSRTLGLFKKYHAPSPNASPAGSPSSARKRALQQDALSPLKRLNASPRSTIASPTNRTSRPPITAQRSSPATRQPSRLFDTPSKRTYVLSGTKTGRSRDQQSSNIIQTASDSPAPSNQDDSAIVIDDEALPQTPSKQQQAINELPKEHAEQSDGEEIVVRSSGRKRTVSEKLRSASTNATPKSSMSKPSMPKHSTPKVVASKTLPEAQSIQRRAKSATKTTLLKQHPGKENITPPISEIESILPPSAELVQHDRQEDDDEDEIRAASSIGTPMPGVAISARHMKLIHSTMLERLTGRQSIPIQDLSEQYSKTAALIEQTIAAGESNSMLLIGPRGSGKTAMVNQILDEQRARHADDFHVVRLCGFVHTDDKLALRDIWRQLGREMEIQNRTHSYADTMSMLLALLSHPTDLGQTVEDNTITKSVVFILDEFDLFANHPRQTLLYNLFDIAQSRRAPIAVLGLTTRVDAAEQLEKRVKSRFSHRYAHLNLAKSLAAYESICKNIMKLDSASHNRKDREAIETWNTTVDALFSGPQIKSHLSRLFYRTKLVPDFMATMLLPMSTLPLRETKPSTVHEHVLSRLSTAALGSNKLDNISALPALGAAMLVCAARQSIYSIENVSFDIAYEEYKTIAAKMKLQATASGGLAFTRVWTKEVAEIAWMELLDAGYIMDGRVDVSLAELADCGADLGQWAKWCKEI